MRRFRSDVDLKRRKVEIGLFSFNYDRDISTSILSVEMIHRGIDLADLSFSKTRVGDVFGRGYHCDRVVDRIFTDYSIHAEIPCGVEKMSLSDFSQYVSRYSGCCLH